MHKIKILFFATLRDYVGSKFVEMEIPFGCTIDGLVDLLVIAYPKLEIVRELMMAAVDREYASGLQVIPQGAEIALFPPVSGG
jgi:molybdopterin converting factor subunit 1